MARLIHFVKLCAEHDRLFFEAPCRELAWNREFRGAVDRLVDQLVLTPVGIRVDNQGQTPQVYLCDPRTFAATGTGGAVPWDVVRKLVISQDWQDAQARKLTVPVTVQYVLEGLPKRPESPKALPAKEAATGS